MSEKLILCNAFKRYDCFKTSNVSSNLKQTPLLCFYTKIKTIELYEISWFFILIANSSV